MVENANDERNISKFLPPQAVYISSASSCLSVTRTMAGIQILMDGHHSKS